MGQLVRGLLVGAQHIVAVDAGWPEDALGVAQQVFDGCGPFTPQGGGGGNDDETPNLVR